MSKGNGYGAMIFQRRFYDPKDSLARRAEQRAVLGRRNPKMEQRKLSEEGQAQMREALAGRLCSLRDLFAAHALQGYLANGYNPTESRLAEWAYAQADRMIEQRSK